MDSGNVILECGIRNSRGIYRHSLFSKLGATALKPLAKSKSSKLMPAVLVAIDASAKGAEMLTLLEEITD